MGGIFGRFKYFDIPPWDTLSKADPFHNQRRWENWKKNPRLEPRFSDQPLSDKNRQLIVEYLLDMEAGFNVARKGRLSCIRLNSQRQRVTWVVAQLGLPDVTQASAREVQDFFNAMHQGRLLRHDGKPFRSTSDYIKAFTAFWHWYQRRERDRGVPDITAYLHAPEPEDIGFVYFTPKELREVSNHAKFKYRVLMWFLFDSGIRSPTELKSLRVRDFHFLPDKEIYELDIKDAYAKTFGRRIKLVLCSDLLRDYLKGRDPNDKFFETDWRTVITYLRRIFVRTLGQKLTRGGKSYQEIRPYDFRHSSACYWRVRYKQEAAYMYRFGWRDRRMPEYYTKFLGMQDTINQEDIMVDSEAKTALQKELEAQKQANLLMEERLRRLEEVIQQRALAEASAKLQSSSSSA